MVSITAKVLCAQTAYFILRSVKYIYMRGAFFILKPDVESMYKAKKAIEYTI